ncbi:MAG: hypothetical protein JST39_07395 [Bacteroidetes bacterium]|nr:hypothetical protein [Bacteroidota bacterium]
MKTLSFLFLLLACCMGSLCAQQKDSSRLRIMDGQLRIRQIEIKDSLRRLHSPRTAAIRSAIVPGLGQIYNRKYWKLPLVWGSLGVTGGIFVYNLKEYRKVRFAYFALLNKDTASYAQIAPELKVFVTAGDNGLSSLRTYRNEFRKNIDYSVLFFLLFWGLNVVDATVDAHLHGFDVSQDLSLKLKPNLGPNPNGGGLGMSLVLKPKDKTTEPTKRQAAIQSLIGYPPTP